MHAFHYNTPIAFDFHIAESVIWSRAIGSNLKYYYGEIYIHLRAMRVYKQ